MSKLEELKRFNAEYKAPDDVIIAVLSKMENNTFPKDPSIIHKVIFDLKKESKFQELLQDFTFDNSGLTPFSDLLDQVFFRLETSSLLKTLNPTYENYEMSKNKDLTEKSFDKFSEEEQGLISEISTRFKDRVSSYSY